MCVLVGVVENVLYGVLFCVEVVKFDVFGEICFGEVFVDCIGEFLWVEVGVSDVCWFVECKVSVVIKM